MNYKKLYVNKKISEERILKIAPDIKRKPGIYVWYRPVFKFYAGQSVDILERSIQHLMQYDHLGNSIRKYGLYSANNPYGWKLKFIYCSVEDLDKKEIETIAQWGENNIPINITSGGQCAGKIDINQRKPSKNYHDGVSVGYNKCKKEIQAYFEKYLDFSLKGKPNKTKERKYVDFAYWLKNDL